MATKSVKTTRTKTTKTSAPKIARARKTEVTSAADVTTQPAHELIAMRAYERWCARGCEHGHDVEDWLAAEHELSV